MDPNPTHTLRGIGLMVLAVSTFACLDATAKFLSAHYPIPLIVWVRRLVQRSWVGDSMAPITGWPPIASSPGGITDGQRSVNRRATTTAGHRS